MIRTVKADTPPSVSWRKTLITAIVILSVVSGGKTRWISPNDFLSLNIDCSENRIRVEARTLDPFSGMMYIESPSRIGSGASRVPKGCRVRGGGGHEIGLSVAPGSCGWKKKGEKIFLQVYLQYDAYVQQVIDEKLNIECDLTTKQGAISVPTAATNNIIVGQAYINAISEKEVNNIVRIANTNENEEEGRMKIAKNEEKLEKRNRKLEDKYAALEQFNTMISQAMSTEKNDDEDIRGWMEVWGSQGTSSAGVLEAMSNATLLLRTWGSRNPSRLGACTIRTETGVVVLTDEEGCGQGLTGRSVSRGVEQISHTFTVPDNIGQAKISCKVVSCSSCHESCSFDGSEVQKIKLADATNRRDDGRSFERTKDESKDDVLFLESSVRIIGGELQEARVDEQSVEPDVHNEPSNPPTSLIEHLQNDTELCMSPSRLVLMFGILILVLVLALLFSCILWVKARARFRPPRPFPPRAGPQYRIPPRASPYIRVIT